MEFSLACLKKKETTQQELVWLDGYVKTSTVRNRREDEGGEDYHGDMPFLNGRVENIQEITQRTGGWK